jgi:hypothetical protein
MAEHLTYNFKLLTTRGSGYDASDYVFCMWDDVDQVIKVYVGQLIDIGLSPVQTSGPSLGIANTDYTPTDYGFKYCTGETLNYFQYNTGVFPYVFRSEQLNSFVCQVVTVCDIQIGDNPTITPASTTTTNDGTITVTATSSNGAIKVQLFDFNYDTEGIPLSGGTHTFTSRFAGDYTIYAKDARGCIDTITVRVPLSYTYGQKYFMEWSSMSGDGELADHKVEIHKRAYASTITELLSAGQPFIQRLESDSEEKFFIIRAGTLKATFCTETDALYRELATEDDREFLIKYYIDGVLDWQGYVIPSLYSEQYKAAPYYITAEATDGLASLKELDFVDSSGNNFRGHMSGLEIISTILKKLDLNISIRSALNIYETNFDATDTDDPLAQSFYDTSVYYNEGEPEKCDVVLKNILTDFRAVIAQADGKWIIWRPEELGEAFDYREFTSAGVYSSEASIDPVVLMDVPENTDRVCWMNESGELSTLPSYGKFIIRQKLIAKDSLLPSHGFEVEDLVPFGFGSYFFAGWNIAIIEGAGATWGLQEINRGDSKGALKIKFGTGQNVVEFYTLSAKMDWTATDEIVFSFDYLIESVFNHPWSRIEFKLKIGDRYYNRTNIFLPLWSVIDTGYNEIYVSRYNDFEAFKTSLRTELAASGSGETVELRIRVNSGKESDHANITALKGESTAGKYAGIRRLVTNGSVYRFYTLRYGDDTETSPDIIRPGDFDLSSNPKVWELTGTTNSLPQLNAFVFDNMVVQLLPNGQELPKEITYTHIHNPNNKRTLEVELFHGDCPSTISNARYAYKNFIKRFDGLNYVPTSSWTRDGFSEADLIQNIILKTMISQGRTASRRLTGTVLGDIFLKPYSCVQDELDSSRKYLAQGYEQASLINSYNIDLYELKDAAAVTAFSNAFNSQQFGPSFD